MDSQQYGRHHSGPYCAAGQPLPTSSPSVVASASRRSPPLTCPPGSMTDQNQRGGSLFWGSSHCGAAAAPRGSNSKGTECTRSAALTARRVAWHQGNPGLQLGSAGLQALLGKSRMHHPVRMIQRRAQRGALKGEDSRESSPLFIAHLLPARHELRPRRGLILPRAELCERQGPLSAPRPGPACKSGQGAEQSKPRGGQAVSAEARPAKQLWAEVWVPRRRCLCCPAERPRNMQAAPPAVPGPPGPCPPPAALPPAAEARRWA